MFGSLAGFRTFIETKRKKIMNATLKFPTRIQAENFATAWGRYSKKGHTVGAGTTDVEVSIDIEEDEKEWIESYVSQMNEFLNN